MHTWPSILGVILAFAASRVVTAPVVTITAGPPAAAVTAALLARQGDPRPPVIDFGTETVTATRDDGSTYTFNHRIGVKIEKQDNGDVLFSYSDPIAAKLVAIIGTNATCPSNPLTGRDDSSELEPRAPGDTVTFEPVDAFWRDCIRDPVVATLVRLYIDRAMLDGLPVSYAELTQFIGDNAHYYFEELMARAEAIPNIIWATPHQLHEGVAGFAMFYMAYQKFGSFASQIRVLASGLKKDPDKTRQCGEREERPVCVDENCDGTRFGKRVCTTEVNRDCPCANLVVPSPPVTWDRLTLEAQQLALEQADAAPVSPGNPKCSGIPSPHLVTQDAGAKAVDSFCGTKPIDSDVDKEFNHNIPDRWVRIGIKFQNPFTLSNEECRSFLMTILSGCDGNNPDNPDDLKHGGSIDHPRGATLTITPQTGGPIRCNTFNRKRWVDVNVGVDAVNNFCRDEILHGTAGTRVERVFNKDTTTSVTVTMSYYQDAAVSQADCISQFRAPIDNCDHNDPINNPLDNKYGGTFMSNGIFYLVTPNAIPDTFPPDGIAPDGRVIEPICNEGDRNIWPPPNEMEKAINEFCVDGKAHYIGDHSWVSGFLRLHIHISSRAITTSEAEQRYRQGSPVCRPTTNWTPGALRIQECKDAVAAMNKKCDRKNGQDGWWGSKFTYNCVEYSVQTNFI